MAGMPGMQGSDLAATVAAHTTDGTSVEPASTPQTMIMATRGGWQLMAHGAAWLVGQQQSGPRGADKVFATNWLMPMAQRDWGPGRLTLRGMLSLEPATITQRRYPELFQTGETAFGRPIEDGQHPHDFVMELAAAYDLRLGASLLTFYAAPVGAPALGPTAYPHRASASEDPLAPLGHHLEDSTHISDEVLTAGLTRGILRVEASAFHGREPDELRWNIDSGRLDSWSSRLTVAPSPDWSGQYSIGRLHQPEALVPSEDQLRMTASVMYNRPQAGGDWATTLLWGRTLSLPEHEVGNAYLAESTWRFEEKNRVWARVENVDRTNELLVSPPLPARFADHFLARIQAYSLGYDRELPPTAAVTWALGTQLTLYGAPAFLAPLYGAHPTGVIVFLKAWL